VPPGEGRIALTGGIEQTQCVGVIAYHHGDRVVIKHLRKRFEKFLRQEEMGFSYRWNVFAGELVRRV
jgi:hypothetical protein